MSLNKKLLSIYKNEQKLCNICKSFENQKIEIVATFMNKKIIIKNCNAFGNILEDIFFPMGVFGHMNSIPRP
jgi:hypothetical protein